jgi:2-oxoglutarate dehydrogenase E2 component (dihydrolipoamide succinyltransferase)
MSQVPVTMPQLGETVAEGTVSRWLVEVGGSVKANEALLEVSTDKVDTEIAAPVDGVLASVAVAAEETVPVGTVLATIDTQPVPPGTEPDSDRTEYGPGDARPVAPTVAAAASQPPETIRNSDRTKYAVGDPPAAPLGNGTDEQARDGRRWRHRDSPRVRRLARELGVDLATVSPSGKRGRVTPLDVSEAARAAGEASPSPQPKMDEVRPTWQPQVEQVRSASQPAAAAKPPSPGVRVEKLSRRRKVIAERMAASLANTAQLTTVVEVDLTSVHRARKAAREDFERRFHAPLTVLAFVAEAAVHALGVHPIVNARLDIEAGTVTYPPGVNLGIAVDTSLGLIVPVLRGADDLSVAGLARRIFDVASRSRSGSISADELSGGTFTITNTGSRGALFDTPILNAPESAILGLGAAVRRPVIMADMEGEERLAVRLMAYLALTYDHRLIDGADAARYLATVKRRLERPGDPNGLSL